MRRFEHRAPDTAVRVIFGPGADLPDVLAEVGEQFARDGRALVTDDVATANIEFSREGNPRIGRRSQTWVRLLGGRRVVAAHVSLMS